MEMMMRDVFKGSLLVFGMAMLASGCGSMTGDSASAGGGGLGLGRMLGETLGQQVGGDNSFIGGMVGGEVGARADGTPTPTGEGN